MYAVYQPITVGGVQVLHLRAVTTTLTDAVKTAQMIGEGCFVQEWVQDG